MKKLINFLISKKKKLGKKFLPLHEPSIDMSDKKLIIKGINSGYVSTAGKDIKKFEDEIKKIVKSKFVISTINGTSALHIGLKVLGVKQNDEVLVPTISFIAPANAILYNYAIPHFVDSELKHFGIDPEKLENYLKRNTIVKKNKCINKKTRRIIKAIIVVHVFGHPAQITRIISIAKKYRIKVLEDAAEALGSFFNGKHVGTFGDVGILSFNGNKIVTTGVGGAILSNNKKIGQLSKHLTTTAKKKHKWDFIHDMVGYNYRIANINASLGISQLKRLKSFIKIKKILFKKYKNLIGESNEFSILDQPINCKSNFWLQTLIIKNSSRSKKIKVLNIFHKNKIFARPVWKPLHKIKFLKKYPKMNLANSEILENKIINLPSSHYL